jgi:hypothetical protein
MWLRRRWWCSPEARLPRDGERSSEFEALRRILADGCWASLFSGFAPGRTHLSSLRVTPADSLDSRRFITPHLLVENWPRPTCKQNLLYLSSRVISREFLIVWVVIIVFFCGAHLGVVKGNDDTHNIWHNISSTHVLIFIRNSTPSTVK